MKWEGWRGLVGALRVKLSFHSIPALHCLQPPLIIIIIYEIYICVCVCLLFICVRACVRACVRGALRLRQEEKQTTVCPSAGSSVAKSALFPFIEWWQS